MGKEGSSDASHHAVDSYAKVIRETDDGGQADGLLASFDFPDINGLHPAIFGKLFR